VSEAKLWPVTHSNLETVRDRM